MVLKVHTHLYLQELHSSRTTFELYDTKRVCGNGFEGSNSKTGSVTRPADHNLMHLMNRRYAHKSQFLVSK